MRRQNFLWPDSLKTAVIIFSFLSSSVISCANNGTGKDTIKSDHEAISSILDKALLSENPKLAFENSLNKVKSYNSVDSAWISGPNFFVKYKQGGVVTWTIQPAIH